MNPLSEPLRERLNWATDRGAIADGPRRYLMMRPDVLMGAVAQLAPTAQQAWLDAWAGSTRARGAASLRAYADAVGGDPDALLAATTEAAADLGWGRWTLRREPGGLALDLAHSPFVAGWREVDPGPALHPVCAPVRGMLGALAALVLRGPVSVTEFDCAARHAAPDRLDHVCRFHAREVA